MIDARCSARTPAPDGLGHPPGTELRCQLLAGHGRGHATLTSIKTQRRILTWDGSSTELAELPADGTTASQFPWTPGCPTVEPTPSSDSSTRRGHTKRHLRVVA